MGGNIESDVVIVLLVMIVSQIIIIPNALQCIGKTCNACCMSITAPESQAT